MFDRRHRIRRAVALPVLATTLVLGLLMAGTPLATAASATVQAGLTITPSSTTVGTTVRVVGTATNMTGATISLASLGVDVPSPLRPLGASGTGGCHPRNITHLVYCGIQNLAPHASATVTFTVTPAAAGQYAFRTYARETYKNNDTFAYVTLTVH